MNTLEFCACQVYFKTTPTICTKTKKYSVFDAIIDLALGLNYRIYSIPMTLNSLKVWNKEKERERGREQEREKKSRVHLNWRVSWIESRTIIKGLSIDAIRAIWLVVWLLTLPVIWLCFICYFGHLIGLRSIKDHTSFNTKQFTSKLTSYISTKISFYRPCFQRKLDW